MQRSILFLVAIMLFIVMATPLWAEDPPAPVITTSMLPNGDVNSPYSLQLQATGGTPPYTWSIAGGTLPAAITLDPVSGVLSGTPNTKGSTTFTVKALDVNNSSASKRFTLDIFQGDVLEVWQQVESGAGYASTNGIAVDKDGFLYTAGKFYDSTFPSIYKITKNDPDGNPVWTRTYGNGGFAAPGSLVLDNEGNVYVTGNPVTIKYDTNGTELWRQPFPAAARDIAVASDGKVLVTGIDDGCNVFFVTYDSSGNETGRVVDNLGITAYSLGIAVDGSGNAYVSGFTHKDEYMTAGLDICFLRKYDPSGSLVWGRQGGNRTDCDKVTIGDNGYIYVTGSKYHNSSLTDSDFLTLKYDAEGTLIWGKVYVTPYYANSRDVVTDAKGNVYVTGSEGDISTIKFDDALKILWSTYAGLGGFAHGNAIALAPDGSVYVAGSAQMALGAEYSSFIVRYRQRLVINTETAPLLLTGIAYQLQFKAENGVGPYVWSVGSGTLPEGLSINPQTGELYGVPLTEGVFPFSIRVTDAAGSTASKSFIITVREVIFTTESLPPAATGTPYQQQIVARCATPITWSIGSGALPSGLSLSADGNISGTPTKLETATFTLLATGTAGETGSKAFSIPVYTPISITPDILPDGALNRGYNETFLATGGSNNYFWTVASGALPPGMTFGPVYLNPNVGALSGVPTVNGTYTFTLKVTDTNGLVFTKTYSMTIGTVVFYTNTLPKGSLGSSYSTKVDAMGGTSPYTYTLTSGTLPGGLFFQSNGTISGTPATFGQFPLTVQAQDSAGVTCAKNFTLTISDVRVLQVTVNGDNGGYITSEPCGIYPPGNYSASFDLNTSITLWPYSYQGGNAGFIGWSGGGCSGRAPCTLQLTENTQVTATFMFKALSSCSCYPTSGQAPLEVQCIDSSFYGPTGWLWSFSDGYSSSQPNVSHILRADPDYNGGFSVNCKSWNIAGSSTDGGIDLNGQLQPCQNRGIRINRSPYTGYGSVQDAVASATTGDSILMHGGSFTENITYSGPDRITLKGGYDCQFTTASMQSYIQGSLTISSGSMTVEGLVLQ